MLKKFNEQNTTHTFRIDQSFIDDLGTKNYRSHVSGKDAEIQKLRRLECEAYEYHNIFYDNWECHDGWQVDGIDPQLGATEVKTVGLDKFFRPTEGKRLYWALPDYKLVNLLKQKDFVDNWLFIRYLDRPDRPLKDGDNVTWEIIGHLDFDGICANIQRSNYGGGYIDLGKVFS